MKRDYYLTPKSKFLMRFLWKIAGGDRYLLEKATYSDQIKYMCLGGIVLATGVMAALAGGYAFYTIFCPKGIALDYLVTTPGIENARQTIAEQFEGAKENYLHYPTLLKASFFGIIWGLIILNIDRFIVTSTGKGDGTEAITWDEFKGAIPRIVMGTIIALTISKPIEIRMFKSEIDGELRKVQDSIIQENLKTADKKYKSNVAAAKEKLGPLKYEEQQKLVRIRRLDSLISHETDTYCKDKCLEYKEQKKIAVQELSDIKNSPEYKNNQLEIDKYTDVLNKDKEDAVTKAKAVDGLLLRIELAHKVSAPHGGFPWISFFITLLFMAIELTPIFFKLMLIRTPYDYMEENVKELIKAENGIEIKYDFFQDKTGQERHLVINHEVHKVLYEKIKVAEIQKKLTDYAVQKYMEREQKKIDDNLDDYIKQINPNDGKA